MKDESDVLLNTQGKKISLTGRLFTSEGDEFQTTIQEGFEKQLNLLTTEEINIILAGIKSDSTLRAPIKVSRVIEQLDAFCASSIKRANNTMLIQQSKSLVTNAHCISASLERQFIKAGIKPTHYKKAFESVRQALISKKEEILQKKCTKKTADSIQNKVLTRHIVDLIKRNMATKFKITIPEGFDFKNELKLIYQSIEPDESRDTINPDYHIEIKSFIFKRACLENISRSIKQLLNADASLHEDTVDKGHIRKTISTIVDLCIKETGDKENIEVDDSVKTKFKENFDRFLESLGSKYKLTIFSGSKKSSVKVPIPKDSSKSEESDDDVPVLGTSATRRY